MPDLPDCHTEESHERRIGGDPQSGTAQTGYTRRGPGLVARPALPIRCSTECIGQGGGERSRGLESRRTRSWWRSNLTEVQRHRLSGLRETCLTVGVRESEISRIHPIGRSIRPRRDPALRMKGGSGLDSNESADTTDGEHLRCDERLPHRSGRRLTSCRSTQCFKRHTPLLSFSMYSPGKPFPRIEQVLMGHKAVTAWAGHRRISTGTSRGAGEGRLSARVVRGAGASLSIRVMPEGVEVLRRRRACPSSRPH